MISVLFVCMGNICRSPMAHGLFESRVQQAGLGHLVRVDSAGTHAYHVGSPPDDRAQRTAMARGVDLTRQRARLLKAQDFEQFHHVLVMDEDNLGHAMRICPPSYTDRVQLLLDYAEGLDEREVPDPYYGGQAGFERVIDMLENAADGLLAEMRKRHRF